MQELFKAIRAKDKITLEKILSTITTEVNNLGESGWTPLMCAASLDYVDGVELLLAHPYIDVNISIKDWGYTALKLAASCGNVGSLKLLLAHPDINVDFTGEQKGEQKSIHCTALLEAINYGHSKCVKLFLGNPKKPAVNIQDDSGYIPLMIAIKEDFTECLQLLLADEDLDINLQDNLGITALMFAIEQRKVEYAKLILAHPKINVNIQDNCGQTALMRAASQVELLKLLLLRQDTQIWIKNRRGETALDLAVGSGSRLIENTPAYRTITTFFAVYNNKNKYKNVSALHNLDQKLNMQIAEMLLGEDAVRTPKPNIT